MNIACVLYFHKWKRMRRDQRDILVCRRCGAVTTAEEARAKIRGLDGGGLG